jgi:hypothetical protein
MLNIELNYIYIYMSKNIILIKNIWNKNFNNKT